MTKKKKSKIRLVSLPKKNYYKKLTFKKLGFLGCSLAEKHESISCLKQIFLLHGSFLFSFKIH